MLATAESSFGGTPNIGTPSPRRLSANSNFARLSAIDPGVNPRSWSTNQIATVAIDATRIAIIVNPWWRLRHNTAKACSFAKQKACSLGNSAAGDRGIETLPTDRTAARPGRSVQERE